MPNWVLTVTYSLCEKCKIFNIGKETRKNMETQMALVLAISSKKRKAKAIKVIMLLKLLFKAQAVQTPCTISNVKNKQVMYL